MNVPVSEPLADDTTEQTVGASLVADAQSRALVVAEVVFRKINFARALGATRSGKPDAAKPDVANLAELSAKLRDAKDLYWSEIVHIQRQVAAAWGLAEGKQTRR